MSLQIESVERKTFVSIRGVGVFFSDWVKLRRGISHMTATLPTLITLIALPTLTNPLSLFLSLPILLPGFLLLPSLLPLHLTPQLLLSLRILFFIRLQLNIFPISLIQILFFKDSSLSFYFLCFLFLLDFLAVLTSLGEQPKPQDTKEDTWCLVEKLAFPLHFLAF